MISCVFYYYRKKDVWKYTPCRSLFMSIVQRLSETASF